MNKTDNSKRLAKNTAILYGRMLFTMAVGLYTSRMVIDALGFTDYGINNIVGSIVGMFTMLTGSLSGAISRFLTFELGHGDKEKLNRIFSASVNIQLMAAVVIALALEIIGMWYLNNKVVMPIERLEAARWVFHCSVLGFMVSLLTVPYDALIVAHERMSVYAYMSILDVTFKLLVAWVLVVTPVDKLITFAVLGLLITIFMRFVYSFYCSRHFEECRYRMTFDFSIFRNMGVYASWNLLSSLSWMTRDQGYNLVLNIFGGPIVNAARGVANTVSAATRSLSSSFMASSRPQITKTYAVGDMDYSFTLVRQCAKLAYFLMLLVILPIVIEAPYILSLWLVEVPEYAVWFVRLTLLYCLIDSFCPALSTLIQATGKIKYDAIASSSIMLSFLPICYLMLWIGLSPEYTMAMQIVMCVVLVFERLWAVHRVVDFPYMHFLKHVCVRCLGATVAASVLPLISYLQFEESLLRLLCTVSMSLLCTVLAIYYIGCSAQERLTIRSLISKRLKKWRR